MSFYNRMYMIRAYLYSVLSMVVVCLSFNVVSGQKRQVLDNGDIIELYDDGNFIRYSPDGKKMLEGEILDARNKIIRSKYYSTTNGNLYSIIEIRNGLAWGHASFYDTFTMHKYGEGKHVKGKREGEWQFYAHTTGVMHGIENYKNNLMEGKAVYYDTVDNINPNVKIKIADGQYHENLRVGVWTFYEADGTVNAKETYKDSLLNGVATYYYQGGEKVWSKGNFKDGVEEGEWIFYDSSTGLKSEMSRYENGDVTGSNVIYFLDKRGFPKDIYLNGNDITNGPVEHYDSITGKLESVIYYQNDIMVSKVHYNIHTGHKLDSVNIKNPKTRKTDGNTLILYDTSCKDGDYIKAVSYIDSVSGKENMVLYYDCSESIKVINYNIEPNIDSSVNFRLDDQTLISTGKMVAGKRSGIWKEYYRDGKTIKVIGNYYNGELDGRLVSYDSVTGYIVEDGIMKDDLREGKWLTFYPGNDQVKILAHYKNGLHDGAATLYDSSGNIVCQLNYKNGELHGKTYYNHKGTSVIWVEQEFKNGELHGKLKSYYHSGALKRKEKFAEGKVLQSKCYDESGNDILCIPFLIPALFDGDESTYIGDNLNYPESALKDKVEGKVLVGFYINEGGYVRDAFIQKGLSPECNEEALRIISNMPRWSPQYIDGIPVKALKKLPVVFWIPD